MPLALQQSNCGDDLANYDQGGILAFEPDGLAKNHLVDIISE